ncbi:MAG: diguanylate cyclase [Ketobacter sp.]|nr:MAG: diguanylate cyclase [Ketobacter sp.]
MQFNCASGWVSLCFLLGVLLLLASGARADDIGWQSTEGPLTLSPFTRTVKIGSRIRYVTSDLDTPEALHSIPAADWQESSGNTISLGFQTEPHWFVMDLRTEGDVSRYWILELANPMIDHVWLYLYQGERRLQQWHAGDAMPFSQRPLEASRLQFPLQLQPDQDYRLYMKVSSTEALELPLTLSEHFYHTFMSDRRSLVDGIFHGFLIIMAAYSLAIYVILRDKSYLFYACYVLSMLLFFLSQQGLLYEYLFPGVPSLQHYSVPLMSLLIYMSIAAFFGTFLDFGQHFPVLWRVYLSMLGLHALLCLGLVLLPYQTVVSLMALNVAASMVLGVVGIWRLSMHGSRPAQIVMAGWGMLFAFILLFVFSRMGIFYNDFLASYGLRIGVSLEILIFSFALSFRINQERQEKEWALNKINLERVERIRAQELALQREVEASQAKEQSLQMEIQHRESLEQVVEERTADLARTLQDLEKANQELEQLSSRDGLTGLFNRRLFDAQLQALWQQLQRKQQPLALLLLDVDHFKQVNDSLGHPCGDMVLRELGALLSSLLHRPTDVIARYGGEEFAVLLPETPVEGARHVAEMIVQAAADKLYVWEGETLHITVSVGVHVLIPQPDLDQDQLVQGADQALYQAKHGGRNRYVVSGDKHSVAQSVPMARGQ